MKHPTRTEAIVSLVPKCEIVADIGTDHAYLPIELVRQKRVEKAIATDIRMGPLAIGVRHIHKAGLTERIECRLGPGLSALQEDEAEGVILAGMGGELIVDILQAEPEIAASLSFLVLQPMTKVAYLRRGLRALGWTIRNEKLAAEGKKIYVVIYAERGRNEQEVHPIEDEIGPILPESGDPLWPAYLEKIITRKTKAYLGMKASRKKGKKIERSLQLKREIIFLEELKWAFKSKK